MLRTTVPLVAILIQLGTGGAYIVLVDSYGEECFHDYVPEGVYLLLKYQVIDGGFMDIDARLTDPHGQEAHSGQSRHGDNQMYLVHHAGTFGLCFSNAGSSKAPKVVMFDLEKFTGDLNRTAPSLNETADLVDRLKMNLNKVRSEMMYLEARLKLHNIINTKTNHSVLVWAISEFIVVIGLCVLQTYYLLRFFETKRIV